MNDRLLVPPAFQVDDLFGCWAVWPDRFMAVWDAIRADAVRLAAGRGPGLSTLELVPGRGGKSVAVVRMTGVLLKPATWFGTSTVQVRRDIRTAVGDPNVSGLMLRIDSPGGTVAGLSDLVDDVRMARRKLPVWAHVEDMAASAAYEVASQADVVYANSADALVGSIGTIMTVYDVSKMAEREGINPLVFATGPLKGAGVPGTEVTQEQRDYFQGIIDGMQTSFDAAVRAGRAMTAAELERVRTGGVFRAADARGLKLIDGVKPLDKALAELSAAK